MAASNKFDLSSSSSDGPTHPGGQRGPHIAASLDRSVSFREMAENRMSSSLPSTSRVGSVSSQGDAVSLLQTIVSDLKPAVLDQKASRAGELRRSIGSIFGISQEDPLPAAFAIRPLPSSSMEEIRRLKSNLNDGFVKARDRSKALGDAALKMDKCYNSMPRKRSRTDNSSSERSNVIVQGASTPKMGPQSHPTASSLDTGPQKSEDRAKSGAPSRKIRTSLLDMDARANSIPRPAGSMDKDREMFKLANNGVTPPEERGRALVGAVDGWEKSKMKKKRSVIKSDASGTVLARLHDGERESKRGMQQKPITEARPRLNNNHGFRSGPPIGINGVGKLDSASQLNGIGARTFPRNDQDNGSLPNDRRERLVGTDKELATFKANKHNGREDNYAVSPTSMMKMNASTRGPRSNAGSLSKAASPNMNRTPGNSDDWEHPGCVNKLNGVAGSVNRKRSASARSSSPPVVQWGGQKLQKVTRVARRSNLTPVVPNRDDYPVSEALDAVTVNDDGLGFTRRSSMNASQQSKYRGDQLLAAGLSESEESGVVDNKSKDKNKKCSEIEEKVSTSIQKVATAVVLPSRRNRLAAEDDQEDSVRRHGKSGRGVTSARSGMSVSNEKLDNAATAKQMRSTRIGYEKIESKPGRPPTKKWSERKAQNRPRHSANGASSLEFAGESDDDHEELLAAAKAAMTTTGSGKFWPRVEEIVGFLSAESQEFLNQQIRLTDEAAGSSCGTGDCQSLKADLEHNSSPSTPTLTGIDGYCGSRNGTASLNEPAIQSKDTEPFLEELVLENGAQVGVSICQALLSAIIGEDEIEHLNYKSNCEEDTEYGNEFNFEVDAELQPKSSNLESFGTYDRSALFSYKGNTAWGYHDELVQDDLGSNGAVDELLPNSTITSSSICNEYQYNQMSMNDRILLELSEIGLNPEPVPKLAQSEDEDISEGINRLTTKLHEQVQKKKRLLLGLDKAVMKARESQQRELERIALDRLVILAYEKYMACCASGSKNTNRNNKQAALAFVRRTLARCRKFEVTGTSCFSEPPFRDMFSSMSVQKDVSADEIDGQPETSTQRPEIPFTDRSQAGASQSAEREDTHNKYSDTFRSLNHLTDPTSSREDQWSNKLKKKELLLDQVVGSATGILRGKRSERDREGKGQNRDGTSRNGSAKSGRQPAPSNAKGERKKSKPKQKLSASVNGLLGKAAESPNKASAKKDDLSSLSNYSEQQDLSNDPEAIDLSNLQLPEIDVTDFGGQGQDIASWLNIEEDGLQDHDFMGLQIPMDDLSEVNMMF